MSLPEHDNITELLVGSKKQMELWWVLIDHKYKSRHITKSVIIILWEEKTQVHSGAWM